MFLAPLLRGVLAPCGGGVVCLPVRKMSESSGFATAMVMSLIMGIPLAPGTELRCPMFLSLCVGCVCLCR